jgi:RimJ/RimL family protein N-acetyltransferase
LRIKTTRFDIIPYDRRQLKLAVINPGKAAEEIGAVYGQVSAEETASARSIWAMKQRIIESDPGAWLFGTSWQIVSRESRLILGELGFKGIHPNGEIEIGYTTRSEHRCRGVMTEAVDALCRFAFSQTEFSITVISASTKEGNTASEKVLIRNGFIKNGTRFGFNYWERRS